MRRNILIFALIVIATLVLWYFFVWSPQSTRIGEATEAADAAESQVRRLRVELRRLQALQKDAPRLRQEAKVLDDAMPNDPQLAQFILMVQEQADASGIDWISVNPAPPAQAGGGTSPVRDITVAMSVTGGYFQVQDFLVRLETLPRAVKITALTLTPEAAEAGAASTGSPELSATLAMTMFTSAVQTAPPSAGTGGT